MKTAFRKVWRDLWRNKGRTILVVMSITAGVLAIGMITASNLMMEGQLAAANRASNPSHGRITLTRPIDQKMLEDLERLPGIVRADGRLSYSVQWRKSPLDEWQEGTLRSLPDYENQKLDLLELYEGSWPGREDVVVPYNQIDTFHVPDLNETLYFKINEREKAYPVNGVIRDPVALVPPFDEVPSFYVSRDTFQNITGYFSFIQVRVIVPEYSPEAVQEAADQIEQSLRRGGIEVNYVSPTDPGDHWAQATMDGVGLIMTIMAVSSLGLSTFLIINTMNALMVQQIPQIGMMKTVGGLTRQITTIYLAGVAVYGLLALFIAVPAGAFAGNALARWLLTFINVPPEPFTLVGQSLLLQLLTGLLAPLLAGLYPILRGVAIPVAQAISNYGVGQGQYGFRFMDRVMTRIHGIPRLAILALRNTFRRPGRVALTQITLTFAGAIFMMVLSTHQSFQFTLDRIFEGFGFDVLIIFEQNQLIEEIVPLAESRPSVQHAEMWIFSGGFASPAEPKPGAETDRASIDIRGAPADSELYVPQLVAGRDFDTRDGHAILFNQKIAGELGITIGDQVVIEIPGYDETTWTIVGLILDLGANAGQQSVYVPRDSLARDLNMIGRSRVIEVKGSEDTLTAQTAVEKDIVDFFESRGKRVSYSTTALENKELANAQFSILTTILLLMTVLIAAVGGFGLSGTLSINVMERTREIGVMRAVGASSVDIGRIFIGEGLLLGLVSWLTAIPLSAAAGKQFVNALGTIIDFPFEYRYSAESIWLWFGIIFLISITASWLPARRATRISVRESLAYE